jgi:hypothetical protein
MSEINNPDRDRASDPTPSGGTVVERKQVSSPGAAVTVIDITISSEARRALKIGSVQLKKSNEE